MKFKNKLEIIAGEEGTVSVHSIFLGPGWGGVKKREAFRVKISERRGRGKN
jgi:hypothetical protein